MAKYTPLNDEEMLFMMVIRLFYDKSEKKVFDLLESIGWKTKIILRISSPGNNQSIYELYIKLP